MLRQILGHQERHVLAKNEELEIVVNAVLVQMQTSDLGTKSAVQKKKESAVLVSKTRKVSAVLVIVEKVNAVLALKVNTVLVLALKVSAVLALKASAVLVLKVRSDVLVKKMIVHPV